MSMHSYVYKDIYCSSSNSEKIGINIKIHQKAIGLLNYDIIIRKHNN